MQKIIALAIFSFSAMLPAQQRSIEAANAMHPAAVQPAFSGSLQFGANVNERLHWLLPKLLDQTATTWVRGFIPASEFMNGERSFQTDPGLLRLKAAAASGHKVILSIKWDCAGKGAAGPVPAPGSAREQTWFKFADDLISATSGELSILAVNNELFIDTQKPDLVPGPDGQIPMVRFLQRLVEHISAGHPHASGGGPLPIFVGGFTRLDTPRIQNNPATRAMFNWINHDPRVAGVDYHLHQPDMQSTVAAMDFLRKNVPSKPGIVTEFSLVWKWKRHLTDPIGATDAGKAFAKQYGLSPTLSVVDFCNRAFQSPVPEAEWQAFLASQSWFEPNYLNEIGPEMQSHGVIVATYAFTLNPLQNRPRPRHPTPTIAPWYINQLLIPGLAYAPNNSRAPENYGFFHTYVQWQKSHGAR